MKKTLKFAFAIFLVMGLTGIAAAAPFPAGIPPAVGDNDGIPDQYDAVNQLIGTSYTSNANLAPRFFEPDYVFNQLAPNGSVALIGLTAGNSNTLGYYTDLGGGTVRTPLLVNYSGFGFLGDGTSAKPYPAAALNVAVPIGFYLNSVVGTSAAYSFYSEPGLNADGYDHMMTFALPELAGQTIYISIGGGAAIPYTFSNPYMIAWEDLVIPSASDNDYDDMIYLIDKVTPTPEPTTMLLLGLGLIGMSVVRRFRK